MPTYGSPQYGLYSGYIKPGIAWLKQKRGQLPTGFRQQIPRMEQEAVASVMGTANRQGQITTAINVLRRLNIPYSRTFRGIERNIKSAAKRYHPDIAGPEAKGTQQVLNKTLEVLRQNKDILRDYGIF